MQESEGRNDALCSSTLQALGRVYLIARHRTRNASHHVGTMQVLFSRKHEMGRTVFGI